MNAAGRLAPPIPGSPVAPGSLISIRGVRLGPVEPARSSNPSPGPLAGVLVTAAGKPLSLLYVDAARILARLPDTIAPGDVPIVVGHAGQSSPAYTVQVKANSFGIFARQPSPPKELPAELQQPQVLESGPGKAMTLLGTGLGTEPPPDLEVRIGGQKAARVTVQRAAGGLDSLTFEVPANTPLGCQVPVLVRAGGTWSNTVPATLEAGGKRCPDDAPWVSQVLASPGKSGVILMLRFLLHIGLGNGKEMPKQWDSALADFSETSASPRGQRFALPPAGACMTYHGVLELGAFLNPPLPGEVRDSPPEGVTSTDTLRNPFQVPVSRHLDAGPAIAIRGRHGEKRIERDPQLPDSYLSHIGGEPPIPRVSTMPLFLDPGKFDLASRGGKDVGPFSAQVTMPAPLTWTNRLDYREARRSEGVTVKWRQRDNTRLVAILAGAADRVTGAGSLSLCTAAPGSESFTIPPEALANLPATDALEDPGRPVTGIVLASFPGKAEPGFRAEGLDSGHVIPVFVTGQPVSYK